MWVQVQAEWLLRPSQDEALRSAHIGASGVSEVIPQIHPPQELCTALLGSKVVSPGLQCTQENANVQAGGQNFYAEKIPDVPTGAPQEHPTPDAPEPSAEGEAKAAVHYTLHGDGSLQMDWHIDATNVLPAPLPPGLFS